MRVLKLHRGFHLPSKVYIKPPNHLGPPHPKKKKLRLGGQKPSLLKSLQGVVIAVQIFHGLLCNTNISIPTEKKFRTPPYPPTRAEFGRTKAEIWGENYMGLS